MKTTITTATILSLASILMAQTDNITSSITWTEIAANGGNTIKPTAKTLIIR